jgi:thiamine-phosphate pyrophosphorylase
MEIMEQRYNITGGVYLVLDPTIDKELLIKKLSAAVKAKLQVVQIWNNWLPGADRLGLIEVIAGICHPYQIPLFINDDWRLLATCPFLDGVHFDHIPADFEIIKHTIGKPFLAGITCSGNLDAVVWADANGLNYVSFCAMFPSSSAGSCDIVMPATVRQARLITQLPFFVSGGITVENISSLKKETPFDGVAIISGILSADDPQQKVQQYKTALSINN